MQRPPAASGRSGAHRSFCMPVRIYEIAKLVGVESKVVLAKAKDDVSVAIESVDHLRRYVELLFTGATSKLSEA